MSCSHNHCIDVPPPKILIYKIYTLKLFKSIEVFFLLNDWYPLLCFVVIFDVQLRLIIKNITFCKMSKSMGFLVLIGLRGQTKNGRPFELMCITRNLSVIYQLYANVSSLSLYNLIMCHIVSFDFFPSLER